MSMHWTVLLAFPWLYIIMRSFIAAAIGTVAFFGLLVAHEFGHVAVARWRGVYVEEIELFGMHGETSLGLKRTQVDDVLIAWGGVAAQLVVLLIAFAAYYPLAAIGNYWVALIVSPIFAVLTEWNIFLIIIALLPLGPLDGQTAWKAIPMLRQYFRRRRNPPPPKLMPIQQKELKERSEQAAADILKGLGKKHR